MSDAPCMPMPLLDSHSSGETMAWPPLYDVSLACWSSLHVQMPGTNRLSFKAVHTFPYFGPKFGEMFVCVLHPTSHCAIPSCSHHSVSPPAVTFPEMRGHPLHITAQTPVPKPRPDTHPSQRHDPRDSDHQHRAAEAAGLDLPARAPQAPDLPLDTLAHSLLL